MHHLDLRTSSSLTSASPRPPSQPRVREPVGYHSQVQPEHLQAVLPRVCQGHRLREGAPPSPCPQRTAPLFSRAYAPTAPAPSPPHGPASSRAGGDRDPPSHSHAAAPRSRVTSRDPRTRHRRVFGPFPRPRAPSIPAGWRLTSIPPFIRTFFFCLPTEQLIQRSRGFRRIRRGACAGRLGEARAVLPRRVAREVGAADAFNTNAIGVFLIARLPATLARRSVAEGGRRRPTRPPRLRPFDSKVSRARRVSRRRPPSPLLRRIHPPHAYAHPLEQPLQPPPARSSSYFTPSSGSRFHFRRSSLSTAASGGSSRL